MTISTKTKKEIIFMSIFCLIVIAINAIFAFANNYLPQIPLEESNPPRAMSDAIHGQTMLFPVNITLLCISLLLIIIIMIIRKNRTALIIGLATIFLLLIFSPIMTIHRTGGIAGIDEHKNCSIIMCY